MSSLLFKAQWRVLTHLPWVRGLVKHCWESGACFAQHRYLWDPLQVHPIGGLQGYVYWGCHSYVPAVLWYCWVGSRRVDALITTTYIQ